MKTFAISGSRGYRIPVSGIHLAGKSPGEQEAIELSAAQHLVQKAILSIAATGEFDTFVHGAAEGPDTWAEEALLLPDSKKRDRLRTILRGGSELDPRAFEKLLDKQLAAVNAIEILGIKPDYDAMPAHLKKRAPLLRNTEIVNRCQAILVFWDGNSKGTLDTLLKAHRAGKEIIFWGRDGKPSQGEKLRHDLDGLARRASWRASN